MRFTEIEAIPMSVALSGLKVKIITDDPALTADQNFYNSIDVDDKPGFGFYSDAMNAHKEALKGARKAKLRALTRGRETDALNSIGTVYTKSRSIFESYINTDNEIEILKLVSLIDTLETNELETSTIDYGKKVIEICSTALSYIIGLNKGKTSDEIDIIQAEFSDVEAALNSNRPGKAWGLMSATPVSVSQEDYNKIRNFIARELSGLQTN